MREQLRHRTSFQRGLSPERAARQSTFSGSDPPPVAALLTADCTELAHPKHSGTVHLLSHHRRVNLEITSHRAGNPVRTDWPARARSRVFLVILP